MALNPSRAVWSKTDFYDICATDSRREGIDIRVCRFEWRSLPHRLQQRGLEQKDSLWMKCVPLILGLGRLLDKLPESQPLLRN
jgi:hypothetical protein